MGSFICVPRVCGGDPELASNKKVMILVFPAYAGVILDGSKLVKIQYCVPRICGGDPTYTITNGLTGVCLQ